MTTHEIVFLTVMLILFVFLAPWLSRRDMARLRRTPADALPAVRRTFYNWTLVSEWGVTGILLCWWLLMGRGVMEIGLHLQVSGWQWLAVAASLAVAVVFTVSSWRAADNPGDLDKVRGQLGDLKLISPHTRAELRHFYGVSLTAGICEEILYRGLLMTALAGMIGLWPAVIVSSVVFGIGHSYQGAVGVLRTGLVGLVLALVVVFTGSLPVAMLIHAVIDMVQGRLLRAAVNTPRPMGDSPVDQTVASSSP